MVTVFYGRPPQWSQCSSLIAHWLSVPGDHGSNPCGGEEFFLFRFWVVISWLPFTFELIHEYAKWLIHKLVHPIWLSIRLNNLIAGHKTKRIKKFKFITSNNETCFCLILCNSICHAIWCISCVHLLQKWQSCNFVEK